MKKLVLYAGLGTLLFASSCTKDFEEINTDPTQASPENFDPNYFLSSSERIYQDVITGYSGPILFQSGWVQILAMPASGGDYYTNADKYLESSNTNTYAASSWTNGYRSAALANEILVNRADDPMWSNINAMATIMKVLNLQYITDVYGAAPYSEAFKAREQLTLPKYDSQQEIYTQALTDLEAAVNSIDPAKLAATADISSLAGDASRWKRFGYSLMLRLAMRLVKVDPDMARTWAEKAYAGGTLTSADDVYFKTDNTNGYANGNVNAWLVASDFYQVRWSKTMIDYLKGENDPRLGVIAEVPQAGLENNSDQALAGDKTPATQLGLPNGYDLVGGSATNIVNSPGYPGGTGSGADATPIGKYSRPAIDVYANRNLPVFVLTYAESELLLAEAAVRGWQVGSAADHYKNGVTGAMLALNAFKAGAISPSDAANFAAANPLDVSSTENSLEMINTQYWATTGTLFNFGEAWNNWKRSGYPVLTPVNYPGNFGGSAIPRRQTYPTGETTNNRDSYQQAVGALPGGDKWSSSVWWDQ